MVSSVERTHALAESDRREAILKAGFFFGGGIASTLDLPANVLELERLKESGLVKVLA